MAVSVLAPWYHDVYFIMYCDVTCCQMETMKLEIEYATSAMDQSDAKVKQREDQLRESYVKVCSKT
jgi:hypothetical protein